jgi:alginate O-acetyltransferase complex protein AlgI
MSFSSIEFLVFFPVAVAVFYILPQRGRWMWLLATSCIFFAYLYYTTFDTGKIWYYSLVLFAVASFIVACYVLGILIEKTRTANPHRAKILLVAGIIYPLVLLFVFKYFNFIDTTIADVARVLRLNYPAHVLKLIIPLGISYYTLQGLSYLIEVNRGMMKAERHFGMLALYFLFFPKMVAGPFERPNKLLPQLYQLQEFDYARVTDGLKLMAWGFFKKLVIADRVAITVNEIYNNPHDYWGIYFIIANIFFSFQVYCDFSGYSDIAVGSARVMGFNLIENFRRPFLDTTTNGLWRRWHISLVAWLRDYVYIPMGGNRVSRVRWWYNIAITFLSSGLWHGANWTFIVWSGLNAFFVLFSDWTKGIRSRFRMITRLEHFPRVHTFIGRIITFILFTLSVNYFRANSLSDGFYITRHYGTGLWKLFRAALTFNLDAVKALLIIPAKNTVFGFSKPAFASEMMIATIAIIALFVVEIADEKTSIGTRLSRWPWYVRWTLYALLMYSILFLGIFANQQFIYFRF